MNDKYKPISFWKIQNILLQINRSKFYLELFPQEHFRNKWKTNKMELDMTRKLINPHLVQ